MRVWRWEHAVDRQGPYQSQERNNTPERLELRDLVNDLHAYSESHPGPRSDGLMDEIHEDSYFGCPSREMLDEWFSDVPEAVLRKAGYVIAVYEINDDRVAVSKSGRQVVYRWAWADLVEQL